MPSHLQLGLLIALVVMVLGIALMIAARRRLRQWTPCTAHIVSVESRDPDWDMLNVRFSVGAKQFSVVIPARSELGYLRRRAEAVSIRYNPSAPAQACLASSRGKLQLVGVFLFVVGAIGLVSMLAMPSEWR